MTPKDFEMYYQLPQEERMGMFKEAIAEIENDKVREFYQSLPERAVKQE